MSMFNHSLDAFESKWDCYYGDRVGCEGSGSPPDPLYHHIKLDFETLRTSGGGVEIQWKGWMGWIPKSIIRERTYVHRRIFLSIVRKDITERANR